MVFSETPFSLSIDHGKEKYDPVFSVIAQARDFLDDKGLGKLDKERLANHGSIQRLKKENSQPRGCNSGSEEENGESGKGEIAVGARLGSMAFGLHGKTGRQTQAGCAHGVGAFERREKKEYK